ncbi:MAG: purine-binding chemotaxis protein CheW [Sporocytophaga sp.]|uniref:chemotaxis protein CheW n=1 Tax=Sporocytophaga sp. TaxID=2231183 RepID=UPI001B26A084|nr:chemotaxis protein CheW [Sporocytophaga sp.]MBO9703133.1 purine-binding chemotaxis protein CheW [Sporocytophaga sp.]
MKEDTNANINSYLTFKLGKESFAANVGKVLEILEVPNITKVPKSPEYMTGVINLRGNVLPVIDTRIKFGLPKIDCTVNTCIIVINVEMDSENIIVGALVDSVQEVLEIQQAQIQPSPSLGSKYKAEFLEGMTKYHEDFIMLLNIDKVFSADELILVKDSLIS